METSVVKGIRLFYSNENISEKDAMRLLNAFATNNNSVRVINKYSSEQTKGATSEFKKDFLEGMQGLKNHIWQARSPHLNSRLNADL